MLAAVGIFSLLVGASVRLRKPDNQATLHFFWLCMAFFGVLALSYSGRLDTLDQVFYWGDAVARLLLPPLFLHFALMFPDRPDAWARTDSGRSMIPLLYLPALLLGGAHVAAIARGGHGEALSTVLAAGRSRRAAVPRRRAWSPGLVVMTRALAPRALGHRAPAAALDRLGHGARRAAVRLRLRAAVRVRLRAR